MKVWLLAPIRGRAGDPWEEWYDKAFGFVVIAENEHQARQLASREGGDEKNGQVGNPWTNFNYSTCTELVAEGEPRVVISNFAAG